MVNELSELSPRNSRTFVVLPADSSRPKGQFPREDSIGAIGTWDFQDPFTPPNRGCPASRKSP